MDDKIKEIKQMAAATYHAMADSLVSLIDSSLEDQRKYDIDLTKTINDAFQKQLAYRQKARIAEGYILN
jgi:hypothetical protein